MKALDLYKFITNNSIECHKTGKHQDDVILFVEIYHLKEWNELLGNSITDENGIDCVMKDGYFCFYMKYICDFFGIELDEVFKDIIID